jgi:hypothetical protein
MWNCKSKDMANPKNQSKGVRSSSNWQVNLYGVEGTIRTILKTQNKNDELGLSTNIEQMVWMEIKRIFTFH